MTDIGTDPVVSRRKAIAGLGVTTAGLATGLNFASAAGLTAERTEFDTESGGVIDIATAVPAGDGGLGIDYEEIATKGGGGVTGLADDKSTKTLEEAPYDLDPDQTSSYGSRILYATIVENPHILNRTFDFSVSLSNVAEIADGNPFETFSLKIELEAIGDGSSDPLGTVDANEKDLQEDGNDGVEADRLVQSSDSNVVADADVFDSEDNDTAVINDTSSDTETAASGAEITLRSPKARLRTRPATDFKKSSTENHYGGYRVIVTGGTIVVDTISNSEPRFDPDSGFDIKLEFRID